MPPIGQEGASRFVYVWNRWELMAFLPDFMICFVLFYGKSGRFRPDFCGKYVVFVAFLWRNKNTEIIILTNTGNRVYT